MNLVLWTVAVTPGHYPLLRRLKHLGYEGVEIPVIEGDGEDFDELRRVLDGEGLLCTTLINLQPDANPVSPELRVRQAGLDSLKWAVHASRLLGISVLSGPLYVASDTFTGAGPTEAEMGRAAAVSRDARTFARSSGITLCLEYLGRFETYLLNTAAAAAALVDRVGVADLALAYDTHHAHLEEDDVGAAIGSAGRHVRQIHFSESHRGTFGTGLIDRSGTVRALKAVGYDGWLMVEAFSTEVTELARKTHVWCNAYSNREEVAAGGVAFARNQWG